MVNKLAVGGRMEAGKGRRQPQVTEDKTWTKVETIELERSRWIQHVREVEWAGFHG